MRTAVAAALALVLVLGLSSCRGGGPGSGAGKSSRPVRANGPDGSALQAASSFLDRYMVPGGRIERTDQGGDTVSEGQAYGMLAAAALGDRARFDEIWSWTEHNLRQSDGLFAFHWQGGHVVDAQPAADADLDTARALLVASCRFGESSLRSAALGVGQAILAHETARAGPVDVLLPGPWAKRAGALAFNPSYVDPTTLGWLSRASGDSRFSALAAGGTRLVNELTRPLPPDWASVNVQTGQATPVAAAGSTSGPGMFTYDAPRTLVRFAVDPSYAAQSGVARAWSVFSKTQPQDIVTEHQLSGTPAGTDHSPVTLVAVAAAAKAASDPGMVAPLLAEAEQLNAQHPTYYGSAWVALGRLLLTTRLLEPCGS
jgi:endo-1,4-beta-D-glucanase Y